MMPIAKILSVNDLNSIRDKAVADKAKRKNNKEFLVCTGGGCIASGSVQMKKRFEEKIKATTELFKAMLDIRKEISKSVKDEIEMRRRMMEKETSDFTGEDSIAEFAKKINEMNKPIINNILPLQQKEN